MRLQLKITINSLLEATQSRVAHRDIFRLVNLVKPRDWHFEIRFRLDEANELLIRADPPLSRDEFLVVADGRLEALYCFDELAMVIDGRTCVLRAADVRAAPATASTLEFGELPGNRGSQIRVAGFRDMAFLQRDGAFSDWLLDSTWVGSSDPLVRNRIITCSVFGIPREIKARPIIESLIVCEPCYRRQIDLGGFGASNFLASIFIFPGRRRYVRHSQHGVFDPAYFQGDFWRTVNLQPGEAAAVEIQGDLRWHQGIGPVDYRMVSKLLTSLKSAINHEARSEGLGDLRAQIRRNREQDAADQIARRQNRLRESRAVYGPSNGPLFKEPTSENELVALYMKLEASAMLPFECRVLEYTPQAGIDALGDFRLCPTDAFKRFAPIEFESRLENYFDHDHPAGQTHLIICWSADEDAFEGLEVRGPRTESWLRHIQFNGYVIPVVIVERIPGIRVQ